MTEINYRVADGKLLEKISKTAIKVNKELSEYKSTMAEVNINQEARQTANGRRVVSLPKTSGEGHGQFGMQGLTATNLIDNGDFRDGAKKWRDIEGWEITKKGIKNNGILKQVPFQIHSLSLNNVYYYAMDLIELREGHLTFSSSDWETTSPNLNTVGKFSLVSKPLRNISAIRTSDNFNGIINNIRLINLTQTFGAGNEPTKEEADKIFSNYFEDTHSVNGNIRVKSVGKNLINEEKITLVEGWINYNNGNIVKNHEEYMFTKTPFYIKNNFSGKTLYLNKLVGGSNPGMAIYDKYDNYLTGGKQSVKVPEKANYLLFSLNNDDIKNIQLEIGSTATPYEPYTESTQYLNAPKLRSLPNGVSDEIRPDGRGGYEVVKRVGSINDDFVLTNNFYLDRTISQFDIYRLTNWDNNSVNIVTGSISAYATPSNLISINSSFAIADWGKPIAIDFNIPNFNFKIKKELGINSPKDLVEYIKNNQIEIYYQLAEPKIVPIYPSGNLITQPSGTVCIEDVVADVATYNNKVVVGRPELLIKKLDQLSVMDFETGGERKLDVFEVEIAGDGTSFTHPELTNEDIVFFEYYYTEESTNGLASIEYFDSRYTIKDSVTDKHYKWSISIANGVPKIDLEEI